MKEKVLLGMSGGYDSAWSCKVLEEMGYEVEGLFLSLHRNADSTDAESSADKLGIKLHIAHYEEDFKKEVENYFVGEYKEGRTPNPCVECNRKIKFDKLLKEADKLGIKYIATGHYVRVLKDGERYSLKCAKDKTKDQSYFLWKLSQEQLSRFIAPLSEYEKSEVKALVQGENLINKNKESQEICFIEDDDYISYLKKSLDTDGLEKAFGEGNFVTLDGKVIGKHMGVACYTVGQRKGLGVALGRPAYVVDIKPDKKEVVLGFEEDNVSSLFYVDSLNFVSIPEFEGTTECFVRPRYRSPLIPATVTVKEGRAEVKTITPIKKVCLGQSAVFYDENENLMFGGYIFN